MKSQVSLEEVFSPRGVAIVGVSNSRVNFAEMVLFALIEAEFPNIYPVNPKYEDVQGLPCYPSILDIPGPVDHVVVNIPAEASLKLLDECTEKGVRSVHFFTAGFGESGEKDRTELEQQMLEKAKSGGFRIIGPNCVGLFVPKARLVNLMGAPLDPGPVSFISQSGGHAQNFLSYSRSRGIRYSKVVSYGNATDVDENELLEYLLEDSSTEIIGAYIEGVKDGRRFSKVLEKVASQKPVIVYKGGQTEAGKRAAFGHTASMTSSVDVFKALCHQKNAILTDNLEELVDVTVALRHMKPFPTGKNTALVGAGGGPAVLAGDEMVVGGLDMPGFSQTLQSELKKHLPLAGSIFTNPLDTPNMTQPDAISSALNVLGPSKEIDILVYHLGFHPIGVLGFGRFSSPDYLAQLVEIMKKAQETYQKPILLSIRPPQDLEGMKEFLTVEEAFVKAGFPVFYSMSRLARAVSKVINWKAAQSN